MSEKILIVDDEEANLRLLTQCLFRYGWLIPSLTSGDALRCAMKDAKTGHSTTHAKKMYKPD
jgi:CheY-like chemotaxis protein